MRTLYIIKLKADELGYPLPITKDDIIVIKVRLQTPTLKH